MVRISIGVNPATLQWEELCECYSQAIYVEQLRADMIASSIGKMLNESFNIS